MTAYVAALAAAVVLALVVNESVRAREERLWRRDQERANAELLGRRQCRDLDIAAAVIAEAERAATVAAGLEAAWLLPCAPDREARP